ncbi:MFS transporter [Streptomyces europaeiscabiei]|uniref:MFS transporter n=1 Tax=Streptomyces europaeiscabiei TaxID=146819 RepID=UPI0039906BC5
MANLVPLQLLIPQQLQEIDPVRKVTDYAVVNGVAGFVVLLALAPPVAGALCDRSHSHFGRRRSWLGGGALAFAAGLLATGAQTTVWGVTLAWSAAMLGLGAATAGLTAVIADRVPERQRGMISSAIYGPQALGVVVGIAVVSVFALSAANGYVVTAVLLVVCVLPFLLSYRDVSHETETALSLRAVIASMADSLRHREFAWAFGGRLLVNSASMRQWPPSVNMCVTIRVRTAAIPAMDVRPSRA